MESDLTYIKDNKKYNTIMYVVSKQLITNEKKRAKCYFKRLQKIKK